MERLVLSADSSEYSAQLEPGEEMTMYFTGEVNENASEQWEDGDIAIDGIYIWDEAGESRLGESEDARLNAPETSTAKEPLNGEAVDGEGPTEEDLVKAPLPEESEVMKTGASADTDDRGMDDGESGDEEEPTEEYPVKENLPEESKDIKTDAQMDINTEETVSGEEPTGEAPIRESLPEESGSMDPADSTEAGETVEVDEEVADGKKSIDETKEISSGGSEEGKTDIPADI